jgi:hypothetical protein
MKYSKFIFGTTLVSSMVLGVPAFANSTEKHDASKTSDMSMMGAGQSGAIMDSEQQGQMGMGALQGNMSNPMMQMMMMQMMQMMMQQHGNKTSMHGNQAGHHGGMGMMGGKQGGMGMMGGGNDGMGMMQEKQVEMKQHMQSMEMKLGNIEALLQELVDLEKTG